MNDTVDLHLHTEHSDGTYSAEQLLAAVREAGLGAFAITDHDTLGGYRAVQAQLELSDPELVPGVELSVTMDNEDLHLLGYMFNPDDPDLNGALDSFQERRNQRARSMVQRLNELNVDISFRDVEAAAGEAPIGRPHVADALVQVGAVRSYDDAFNRYIRNGGPAYVAKTNLSSREAITIIHRAGGVTVLAHPVISNTERFLEPLVGLGLDGIEVWHPVHARRDRDRFRHLAERFRLIVTGGSDFHGRLDLGKYGAIGSQAVPGDCLVSLKQRVQQRGTN